MLAARLAAHAVDLRIPDLNAPDFEHLTLTAILRRVADAVRACPPGPVGLIGSSLGGLAALHFADTYRATEGARVTKLLLLAPALDFARRRWRAEPAQMAEWARTGWRTWHHYGSGAAQRVHYGFVEDLAHYDSYAVMVDLPICIIHGRGDASVPAEESERFAAGRPHVDLRLVDSDHELLDQIDTIEAGLVGFFGLG